MSTVILGAGIIGSSIAYYLSVSKPQGEIRIIDQSQELFTSASGFAGGFLARDWFVPSLAPLGALSFDLHHKLAAEHGGDKKWGFMRGTAFSLDTVSRRKTGGTSEDDWIETGASRAETATGSEDTDSVDWPAWLTKQEGGALELISEESVAQVDPLRLSRFLISEARSRGAKLYNPAKAITLVKDDNGTITGVRIVSLDSEEESIIPCTNLVLSSGSWTPQVLKDLFPATRVSLGITPLAGYSLVLHSPRHTIDHERRVLQGRSHAVFTTNPNSCGFSPEIFTREGGEIYVAGLNPSIPLPARVEDTRQLFDPAEMQKLKDVAVRLMGDAAHGSYESSDGIPHSDDLKIIREGLCFRPVSRTGGPLIGRIKDSSLGHGVRSSDQGGVYIAAGHGPWGISLSLGTGKVVSEMVQGQSTSADVSGLAV